MFTDTVRPKISKIFQPEGMQKVLHETEDDKAIVYKSCCDNILTCSLSI